MSTTSTKIGHGLAKVFSIKIQPNEPYVDEATREQASYAGGSGHSTDGTFNDEPVHVSDYFKKFVPSRQGAFTYVYSLFPFLHWIGRYNLVWLAGDLVAGEYRPSSIFYPQNLT